MPRMQILNTLEREASESPPVFTSVQRKQHFDFAVGIQRIAAVLRTPLNQVGFLLACGYFAATKLFPARTYYPRDIAYVAEHAGLGTAPIDFTTYDRHALTRHQEAALAEEVIRLVQAPLKPKVIFWGCLVAETWSLPGWRFHEISRG